MIIKTGTLEPIVPTGTDWNIEFDCRTKTLKNVSLPLIVSGENNSTILLIKTPLYYNNVDLTTVNCIVKYKTSWTKEDGSINEGQVDLTNTATKFDDYIIYTWALDQRQTRLPGKCDFSLKFFMNLNEDPYQNQTRYYLQKISNENGDSLQIGKDEMVTDIEQKYWSIASLPSSIDIGDGGSIAEGVEPDDSMADSGYDDGYNQGYEDGKNSVIQLEKYASSIRFETGDDSWMNEEMVFNLDNVTTLQNLFTCKNFKTKRLTVNCSKQVTNSTRTFYFQGLATGGVGNVMEHITFNCDISKSRTVSQMINNMPNLRVFDGSPLDLSSSTSNQNFVDYCHNLEYIRIVPNTIKYSVGFVRSGKLSDESVQSIIDGLADLTGGTAQTLTVHQDVRNKLTTEQLAQITNKNWLISPENATA